MARLSYHWLFVFHIAKISIDLNYRPMLCHTV